MIVYTVGTFDLLHVGHLALLNHCKTLGDVVAVGVASDEVVNLYKPHVPIIPLIQRMEMLEALQCVDIVRPYHELEYVSGCKEVNADIFVIGEDWGRKKHNLDVEAFLAAAGKQIIQVRYNPRTSSTEIKQTVIGQTQTDGLTLRFMTPTAVNGRTKYNRGCSSDGRADALQASGQEFDSLHLHQFASVAQKEEQLPCKHQVGGSIPPAGTNRPR